MILYLLWMLAAEVVNDHTALDARMIYSLELERATVNLLGLFNNLPPADICHVPTVCLLVWTEFQQAQYLFSWNTEPQTPLYRYALQCFILKIIFPDVENILKADESFFLLFIK